MTLSREHPQSTSFFRLLLIISQLLYRLLPLTATVSYFLCTQLQKVLIDPEQSWDMSILYCLIYPVLSPAVLSPAVFHQRNPIKINDVIACDRNQLKCFQKTITLAMFMVLGSQSGIITKWSPLQLNIM